MLCGQAIKEVDHLHNRTLPTLQLHRSIIVMVSYAIIIMVQL